MLYRLLRTLPRVSAASFYSLRHIMKPLVVFVLGGPGAGKGTQCERIVQKYGYTHLSAGDLLRDERKKPDSQYGELIESFIRDGKIVPVEITVRLLQRESIKCLLLNGLYGLLYLGRLRNSIRERRRFFAPMDWGELSCHYEACSKMGITPYFAAMEQTMAVDANKHKFLIDGFPRNQDNLQGWERTMNGKADVSFVLFFDCDNETCIERCMERGKSSGRSDDNRESLEKRIQTYLTSTRPIIDQYEKAGKVRKVDASKSVDEVFTIVQDIFDRKV